MTRLNKSDRHTSVKKLESTFSALAKVVVKICYNRSLAQNNISEVCFKSLPSHYSKINKL